MRHPNELWEDTRLEQKSYPIQLFRNASGNRQAGDNILYLHWHEHMEWIVLRQGKAVFYIDSRQVEANAGDVLFVPGGSLHVGYALEEGEVVYDSLVFNAALFNEWVHDPVYAQLAAPYVEGSLPFPAVLSAADDWEVRYQPALEDIVEELTRKEAGYQLIVKAKLYALIVMLARYCSGSQPSARQTEAYFMNRDRFKQLIGWIEQHFAEKLTVRQAAELMRLDPFHFCKQFKKMTGRTFIEYVNVCRANEAERLLLGSEATVGEIALRVGCDNANYFTKLYKQYKGITPSAARRRSR
ncbi:AraC family transcriptional regulator [Paenibacillus protaetiae]|uniref:AraC family transcriptional regulator n=1 Tax=Paenibacillus protaetiae TaxID=2509456 RepID=A0A4P6F422_9BACL|nr:AraC family transcriptional regulator [Paenibacillus protaetiae]QAY67927.1 AraC family transcriptional regulator [Paenibacillus protaetiae]